MGGGYIVVGSCTVSRLPKVPHNKANTHQAAETEPCQSMIHQRALMHWERGERQPATAPARTELHDLFGTWLGMELLAHFDCSSGSTTKILTLTCA